MTKSECQLDIKPDGTGHYQRGKPAKIVFYPFAPQEPEK